MVGLRALIALIAGAAVSMAVPAPAANFEVSPVNVTLAYGELSQLIAVTNQGSDPLRFQLDAYAWDQQPDGQMALAPTDDMIFFPRLFEIQPHEVQNIRVGVMAPATASEKTYRLLIRQLKPVEAPSITASVRQANIAVLTNLNIPVFVEPASPSTQPSLNALSLRNGQLSFTIGNAGNAHLRVTSLQVKGLGSGEQPVFSKKAAGGYVLAHGSRNYELAVPKADCAGVHSLNLLVETDHGKLHGELPVNAADCGQN